MSVAELQFQNNKFIFRCTFHERELAKAAKFRWDPMNKYWFTPDATVAAKLKEFATAEVKTKLNPNPAPTLLKPLPPTPEGLELFPHQREAILFALQKNRCYLGLDPGLGKTIVAATIASALALPVVYVSPPFLRTNVHCELKLWAPTLQDVLIVSDSMLLKRETIAAISSFAKRGAVIFIDEAHRFKNMTAHRTRVLIGSPQAPGLVSLFERQVFMSGTPMPNRPMELYSILAAAAPETIDHMSRFKFGRRYCAGFQGKWGWDFSGASNMVELSTKIIPKFMLRQKKELLNLPPKLEEIFVVSDDMSPRLCEMNEKLGPKYYKTDDLIKEQLADNHGVNKNELHVASYRRLLGVEKVKAIVPYIKSLLDETEENILVFAYHKEVIAKLKLELADSRPLFITGETPVDVRQSIVKTFQEKPEYRILIGNYLACGVGFTITKATRVIFCEFDWVPGVNDQASDRAHRIGQKNTVLVQYVVYKDSVDKLVIETLLRKRKSIKHV